MSGATHGIGWNGMRARRGMEALGPYSEDHGDGLRVDAEATVIDLVTDVLHAADNYGVDARRVIRMAIANYEGERDGDVFA
jgi:hypothetical protein